MRFVLLGVVGVVSLAVFITLAINWDSLSVGERGAWLVGTFVLDAIIILLEPSRPNRRDSGTA